ncbi:MAG: choice-of-anchor Q domain-containing protein [Anaerolineae bacterium]
MILYKHNKRITSFLLIGFILCAATWALAQPLQASVGETTATCTVDMINGGTHASIQAAIDDPACDLIQVANGIYNESLVITRSLTIIGQDKNGVTVDAIGSSEQTVKVQKLGADVTLKGMTLAQGFGGSGLSGCGGGIWSNARLTLDDMIVVASSAPKGGGICNTGTLTLTHSLVSGNHANNYGGGLYNEAQATAFIDHSEISGNDAISGGGIYQSGHGITLTLRNSLVAFNDASGGGGMMLYGPSTVENNIIQNNHATKSGGGMVISCECTINQTQILSNTADWSGGGIEGTNTFTITNSTFRNNIAQNYDGGGVYFKAVDSDKSLVISNTNFENNFSGDLGSAIFGFGYLVSTTIKIDNSYIANNQCTSPFGCAAIETSTQDIVHTGELFITDSRIISNYNDGIDTLGSVTMTRSIVSSNLGHGVRGHGVSISDSLILSNSGKGVSSGGNNLTIWFSFILNNAGTGIGGSGDFIEVSNSTISGNYSGSNGGGIFTAADNVSLTNVTISGNWANGDGGGIWLSPGNSAYLNSVTITDNTADADGDGVGGGGGIYSANTGVISVTATVIAGNIDNSGFILNANDCYGDFTSLGFNFIGEDTACNGFTDGSDQVGTATGGPLDPLLLPLWDNGGPAWTHLPDTDSPLIDASSSPDCPLFDQRGVSRTNNAPCDIGAVEVGTCQPPITPTLQIAQNGDNLDLSWDAHIINREVAVWRGSDGVPTNHFSNVWTNPGLQTTYTDLNMIGTPTLDHFYYAQGQNSCGDFSAVSNMVGELEFPVMAGGNGRALRLTLISVPLTGTIPATADDLAHYIDPNGSVKKVARWNKNTGSWIVRTVGANFGTPNFPVQLGDVLMIGADTTAPDSFPWVGDVPASGQIQYNLTKQAVNFISIPLNEATNFTMTAEGLAADIGGVRAVAMWDASQQKWVVRQIGVSGTNFTVVPGRPYAIMTTNAAPPVWP